MAVHQLLPTFSAGDATGQSALHFQLLLRRLGISGQLYASEVAPELTSVVQPASALHPRPDDLVLYHHGIASACAGTLMHLPCRRGVVFHNITPARFYPNGSLRQALLAGRSQLAAMAPHVHLAIGVSQYNCAELREAGYRNVHSVPLFVEPHRFAPAYADRAMSQRLAALGGPIVLSVSRIQAHKRFEDLVALHRELRRLRPDAQLVLVGGYAAGEPAFRALQRQAKTVGNVHFLGRVDHSQLVAAYRAARLFVSMSEHEGFGVPFLEAMASDVPVMAFAAAAVPETLGGRGIAFTEKRFAFLAELANQLIGDNADAEKLRKPILAGQKRRLDELSAEVAQRRLAEALASLPGAPLEAHEEARGSRAAPLPASLAARKKAAGASGPAAKKLKVGFIVQRYGEQITGGAEALARMVAHRLSPHWNITVLTTCAKDHLTWANELPAGDERDGPVRVKRFASTRPREMRAFNQLSRKRFGRPLDRLSEEHWVAEQGPLVPGLFEHLEHEGDQYDGFVAFTYLYTLSAWGLPMVADRAIMVPTAHDEAPFAFDLFSDVFERPRALFCSTPEEESLIERRFPRHARTRVVGVGVEVPSATRPARFMSTYGLTNRYLMYVGRIEAGKGIPELLAFYQKLRRSYEDAPDLVLAGAASMQVKGEGVRCLGRISERDKYDGLAGALATVVPSQYESLSLLALESFASGTPVLGNAASEVVAGQVQRSRAGALYQDAASFIDGVRQLGKGRELLKRRALSYAQGFTWAKVVSAYREEMNRIVERAA